MFRQSSRATRRARECGSATFTRSTTFYRISDLEFSLAATCLSFPSLLHPPPLRPLLSSPFHLPPTQRQPRSLSSSSPRTGCFLERASSSTSDTTVFLRRIVESIKMDASRFLAMAMSVARMLPAKPCRPYPTASERRTCKFGTGYASIFTSGMAR